MTAGLKRFGELMQRGYSEDGIRKILGENALRVLSDVEATGQRLRSAAVSAGQQAVVLRDRADESGPVVVEQTS